MNKATIAIIAVAAIIVPITVYAISPYFTESSIDEALPDNVVTTQTEIKETEMTAVMAEDGRDEIEAMEGETETVAVATSAGGMAAEEMAVEEMAVEEMAVEEMESGGMAAEEMAVEEMESGGMAAEEMAVEEMESGGMAAEEMAKPASKTYQGQFVGVGDGIHDAQGVAKVLPLDDRSQILRLEEFRSTNGPDLYVYLATDKDASDFVNLGELKANRGNQNYEIPSGVDLEKHNQVLVWCKAFSVLFGSAELAS